MTPARSSFLSFMPVIVCLFVCLASFLLKFHFIFICTECSNLFLWFQSSGIFAPLSKMSKADSLPNSRPNSRPTSASRIAQAQISHSGSRPSSRPSSRTNSRASSRSGSPSPSPRGNGTDETLGFQVSTLWVRSVDFDSYRAFLRVRLYSNILLRNFF